LSAAATLQPLEMPQKMPSSAARRRAVATLSSVVVVMTPGEQGDVEVARHEAVADALDAVVAPRARREQRALRGLDGVEAHGARPAAEIAADAREEPPRALRVDERADPRRPHCSQISGPVVSMCVSTLSGCRTGPGTQ
jgi:hypothetical protein